MKIVVVGGGAAGMMAAIYAAKNGADVTLVEKNEKLGKKIYITGKGRCNLTNNCTVTDFFKNVVSNEKFLFSAINSFSPSETMSFFEENGLELMTERGNRVYPKSEKASDVTRCLEKTLKQYNVKVLLNSELQEIMVTDGIVDCVKTSTNKIPLDRLILACGGITYKATGSDGKALKLCQKIGHKVIEPTGSLLGIKTESLEGLAGLSLKNVVLSFIKDGKKLFSEFGEMLFTHSGVSGPIVLTLSARINRIDLTKSKLAIDLKPALTEKVLDLRLLKDFEICKNKQLKNALDALLPQSIIPIVIEKSEIFPETQINSITVSQRNKLLSCIKNLELDVIGLEDINGAVITAGGITVKEVNPSTMQSKLYSNLFFAGEMIDVDALTGGFNMQIAFSTGMLAGKSAALIGGVK